MCEVFFFSYYTLHSVPTSDRRRHSSSVLISDFASFSIFLIVKKCICSSQDPYPQLTIPSPPSHAARPTTQRPIDSSLVSNGKSANSRWGTIAAAIVLWIINGHLCVAPFHSLISHAPPSNFSKVTYCTSPSHNTFLPSLSNHSQFLYNTTLLHKMSSSPSDLAPKK
jgi:hypothetical protein